MSIPNYKYEFNYNKKPEDFFDNELYEFAKSDMKDKFKGNREKNKRYYESLSRLKSHIKTERFSFKDSNNNVVDGEYQTILNYTNLKEDLKLLQLEGLKERLEKTSKALAGDASIYSNEEDLQKDLKYIETNNFAYNRNQMTTQNLKTLGRYGDVVKTNSKIFNALLFVRNNIRAPINRFIGKGASNLYSRVFDAPSGLYSNKPTHRYKARRDYFYNKEKKELEKQGKKIIPFVSLWKARLKAIINYDEANNAILEAGKESIKKSVENIQQSRYLSDKYEAVSEHIKYLREKLFIINDTEEINSIKEHLAKCLNIRDEIRESEFFEEDKVKERVLSQTDVITLEQHLSANKDNVTRTITGAKMLATAGIIYAGPKIRNWILEHTKIQSQVEKNTWVSGHYDKQWIEETQLPVTTYTKDDLVNSFSIKNLIQVSKDNTASYSYNNLEKTVFSNDLHYFRGIAQKIDGNVISLSDGNAFNIKGITSGMLPKNLLKNGNISDNATIFDLIAALRTQAGKPTTSNELINQVLSQGTIEKQNEMIRYLTDGIEFWKSTRKSGIATGWNEGTEEINSIIGNLSQLISSRKIVSEGHFKNVFVPGYLESEIVTSEVINPRILKLCNISEDLAKTLSVAELSNMIYENLRQDTTREKLKKIEEIQKNQEESEYLNKQVKKILEVENDKERFKKINEFEDLNKLSDVNYIEIMNSFVDKPEFLMELLKNDKFYTKENFKFILGNLLTSKQKNEIIENREYEKLLETIRKTKFEAKDIDFIINAYEKDGKVLGLFPTDGANYLKNEELILRKTTVRYNDRVIDRLLFLKNIDEKEKKFVKLKLRSLYHINDEILETVNFEMLTSKYDDLAEELSVLTLYPKMQEQICGLSKNEYKIFKRLSKNARIDWVPQMEDLLTNISEYDELINKDDKFVKYITKISKEKDLDKILKTLQIISNPNRYNIKTCSDIETFSREKLFKEYAKNREKEKDFSNLSEYDKLKDFILQRYLGMDFKTAKRIYTMFGKDIEKIEKLPEETEKEVEDYVRKVDKIDDLERIKDNTKRILKENELSRKYLITLRNILEEDDYIVLKELYETSRTKEIYHPIAKIESTLRGFFVRQKNKTLYMINKDDKVNIGKEEAYLLGDNFNLQLTSIESYAHDNWIFKKDDEKKVLDWDCKKVKTHGISSIYCGNKNLSLPPIHGVCYAFDALNENSLLKSAPWDLGAWAYSKDFNILRSEAEFGTMFTLPETQLQYTLRRHNEDVIERRNLRYKKGNGQSYKLPPTYIVSFTETPLNTYLNEIDAEVLTSEALSQAIDLEKFADKEYQRKVNEDELKKDIKWDKTIKEANRRGLKKVIVDRTHTLIKERLENDEKERKLLEFAEKELENPEKMSEFLKLMEDMIVEFDEVRAGTIQKEIKGWNSDGGSNYGDLLHKEMYEKLYSYKVMDDKLGKLERKIKSFDKEKYRMCMERLKEVSGNQVEKISKSYWWYEYDTSHDWYDYYKHAGRELSGIGYKQDKEKIAEMLDRKIEGTEKTGGQTVREIIEEIENIHEYDIPDTEEDWHGRKHINNVVLFSYLIAQNEDSLGNDLELLLQAAKYHDVGRDGNWNGQGAGKRHDKDIIPHAHPSADAAEFYLSKELNKDGNRKYTKSQIAMVKVAIEYHEVFEKNKNIFNEEKFEKLCKKENVKEEDIENTRLMCIYLKDADAVDRTRFLYEEKGKSRKEQKDNLDLRYLRTNTAISLRDYAREISNINHENEDRGIRKDEIPEVLNKYSVLPQKVTDDWSQTQREIKYFTDEKERRKKAGLDEKDLLDKLQLEKSSTNYFGKKRQEFKEFIEKIKFRLKKDER